MVAKRHGDVIRRSLENPSVVVARSNIPILAPRERYERIGNVPNVVFSCGAFVDKHVSCF